MPRSASSIRHIVRNLKLEYEGCSLEDIIRDRKIILLYIDDLEVDVLMESLIYTLEMVYLLVNSLFL